MDYIATLDCVNKVLNLKIKGKTFEIYLNDGDLEDFIHAIKLNSEIYDLHFSWVNDSPTVTLYKVIEFQDLRGDSFNGADYDNPIVVSVGVSKGSKEDLFGVKFINGFDSWCETFHNMMVIQEEIESFNEFRRRNGLYELIKKIKRYTFEFEELHTYTNWSDVCFELEVEEFLLSKVILK